jgi:cytochrome c2
VRAALILASLFLAACGEAPPAALGGNAREGKLLLRQYGCGGCHEIPGVASADGRAGPPLAHIARRVYLAGIVPNTPENMAAFIRHPPAFAPRTAMPDMGIGEQHARDMVAYLYTLE